MSKNCNHPTCYDSEQCRREKKAKLPSKIRPRSKKREKLDRAYVKLREQYLQKNPACEVCGGIASDVHHKRGRVGEDYLNVETWLSVCRSCHRWVEEHPEQALEMGYSESRLNKSI
jgi:hypothetical protein